MKVMLKSVEEFQKLLIMEGYTFRSFAKVSGVSHDYISKIAKGFKDPSPKIAKKIHVALKKNFEDIFFIHNGCKSDQKHSA